MYVRTVSHARPVLFTVNVMLLHYPKNGMMKKKGPKSESTDPKRNDFENDVGK